MKDEHIAHAHHQSRSDEQMTIGEPELQTEQERKRHVHTYHIAHDYHQHILAHKTIVAHNVGHSTTINAARQLEHEGYEKINPRLCKTRNEGVERRDTKWSLKNWRSGHCF